VAVAFPVGNIRQSDRTQGAADNLQVGTSNEALHAWYTLLVQTMSNQHRLVRVEDEGYYLDKPAVLDHCTAPVLAYLVRLEDIADAIDTTGYNLVVAACCYIVVVQVFPVRQLVSLCLPEAAVYLPAVQLALDGKRVPGKQALVADSQAIEPAASYPVVEMLVST